ncbi:hypothetical protein [Streptomyces californicus]|uniref:hypothetical protein n=1 Tax=Streptomyces californicus TaxID=67351 RepID=UPI00296FBC46|nr:hypothetical protein [Streptomyces californicus]MDW4912452.1 hypothetical protein [Streptomyces californicus]
MPVERIIRLADAEWSITESDGAETGAVCLLDAGGRTYSILRNGAVPTRLTTRDILTLLDWIKRAD